VSKETLKFAYVGQFHALDLFLSHPELNPAYVEKPYKETTPLLSPVFLELWRFLKIGDGASQVFDISAADFLATYSSTLQIMKSLSISSLPNRTMREVEFNSRVVVIGEVHEPDSSEWLEGMPTPECLKNMGFTNIEAAFEGYPKGMALDGTLIKRDRSLQEQMEYRARKLSMSIRDLIKNWPAELRAAYYNGQVIDNTSLYHMVNLLEAYGRAGILVHFEGLEAPNYDRFEDYQSP
jgi:hypothetical protein